MKENFRMLCSHMWFYVNSIVEFYSFSAAIAFYTVYNVDRNQIVVLKLLIRPIIPNDITITIQFIYENDTHNKHNSLKNCFLPKTQTDITPPSLAIPDHKTFVCNLFIMLAFPSSTSNVYVTMNIPRRKISCDIFTNLLCFVSMHFE